MKTLKERYYESSEEYAQFELFMKELNKLNDESLDENVLKKVAKNIKARYLELSRRMKKVARSAVAKFKRKRTQTRKRDSAQLLQAAQKQAKMKVLKKVLGPKVNYKELPIDKRIQINQRIVAKHKKKIDKMTKKILRTLKTKEGERIAKNKAAQQEK